MLEKLWNHFVAGVTIAGFSILAGFSIVAGALSGLQVLYKFPAFSWMLFPCVIAWFISFIYISLAAIILEGFKNA
jgi:hypothetical protein